MELKNRTYETWEVSRATCVTARQLQWWDEQQIICPRQEKHRRLYDFNDLLRVRIVAELRRKGLSLQKIRRLLKGLYAASCWDSVYPYLFTDGSRIWPEHTPEQAIERLKKARNPLWLICVGEEAKRLMTKSRIIPAA